MSKWKNGNGPIYNVDDKQITTKELYSKFKKGPQNYGNPSSQLTRFIVGAMMKTPFLFSSPLVS
jgi:hypothetical protein